MIYLFIDCEMGGLSEETSLLELGLILTADNFDIIQEIIYPIKPDNGNYVVTAQGLSINKINLVEHDKKAITYKEAGTKLYNDLNHIYNLYNKIKLIPVGKNLSFDCARIFRHLMSKATWEQFVSYQPWELNGAWRLLEAQGKVPRLEKTSLSDIANHFNIRPEGLHSSLGDCRLYIEVMKRLVQL